MPRATVVLIQKPASPYRQLLTSALEQECGTQGWHAFEEAQGRMEQGQPLMVLWDLHGHQPQEVRALAPALAPEEVGVVLVCGPVDALAQEALGLSGALALLPEPRLSREVAAALEVASATHQRLCDLAQQRRELEQALEERQYIEQAKRVLMEARGCGEAEAMRQLQQQARKTNQKLAAVARQVLKTRQMFNGGD